MTPRAFQFNVAAQATSNLEWWAQNLGAGQSVRMDIATDATRRVVAPTINHVKPLGTEGGSTTILIYGGNAYYDPVGKEIGIIGKVAGPSFYHWLTFREVDPDSGSLAGKWYVSTAPQQITPDLSDPARPLTWSTVPASGHAYDHNTCDPETGVVWHREFAKNYAHRWDGASWTQTGSLAIDSNDEGSLTWVPGVGLVYVNGAGVSVGSGATGAAFTTLTGGASVTGTRGQVGEWNPTSGVFLYGGGVGPAAFRVATAAQLAAGNRGILTLNNPWNFDPSHVPGTGDGQGRLMADPVTGKFLARLAATGNPWYEYDPETNLWSLLHIGTIAGDPSGAVAYTGLPNITSVAGTSTPVSLVFPDGAKAIALFATSTSGAVNQFWMYRHA